MIETEIITSILIVYLLVVISPGPNFLLITRYSLRGHIFGAVGLMIGFAVGATVNASLTMFGLASLLVAFPIFGLGISIAGSFVLILLGAQAVLSVVKKELFSNKAKSEDYYSAEIHGFSKKGDPLFFNSIGIGALMNITNPKGLLFFVSLYAPLISHASLNTKSIVLISGFIIEIIWYTIVISLLSRAFFRKIYQKSNFVFDLALGIMLIFVGIFVLFNAFELSGGGVNVE